MCVTYSVCLCVCMRVRVWFLFLTCVYVLCVCLVCMCVYACVYVQVTTSSGVLNLLMEENDRRFSMDNQLRELFAMVSSWK